MEMMMMTMMMMEMTMMMMEMMMEITMEVMMMMMMEMMMMMDMTDITIGMMEIEITEMMMYMTMIILGVIMMPDMMMEERIFCRYLSLTSILQLCAQGARWPSLLSRCQDQVSGCPPPLSSSLLLSPPLSSSLLLSPLSLCHQVELERLADLESPCKLQVLSCSDEVEPVTSRQVERWEPSGAALKRLEARVSSGWEAELAEVGRQCVEPEQGGGRDAASGNVRGLACGPASGWNYVDVESLGPVRGEGKDRIATQETDALDGRSSP
eukprot:767385-Hanusia_phi.AAC.1